MSWSLLNAQTQSECAVQRTLPAKESNPLCSKMSNVDIIATTGTQRLFVRQQAKSAIPSIIS